MATGSLRRKSHPSVPVGTVALLRPWQPSDAGAVVEAFTDPEIQRWHVRRADSVDEARQWITSWRAGWGKETQLNWALVDRSTGSLMGRVSLKSVDLHDGSAGVAYWMVPAWRGHGLCSQAVIALCQWAFKEAGFHRIGLDHSVLNGASCRVAVKAGFYAEGICKGAALHADGWHDMHRQVRVQGIATRTSAAVSDEYFAARPRGAQVGARASHQSQPVDSRAAMHAAFDRVEAEFADAEVPRPEQWGGYTVAPHRIEFWQGQANRFHDRFVYESADRPAALDDAAAWTVARLDP